VGSQRQLDLVATLVHGERRVWPSPLSAGLDALWARRGRPTCVLASGDPFFTASDPRWPPQLSPGEFQCHPAPSSMSLAAAQLGWPLQDIAVVTLHGRDLRAIIPQLAPRRRVFALSWNQHTPRQLAQLLTQRGFGPSTLHVLVALGGPDQRIRARRSPRSPARADRGSRSMPPRSHARTTLPHAN